MVRVSSPPSSLVPVVVVTTGLRGTVRPVMDLLLRMGELTSEWCPLTDRRSLSYLTRHAKVLAGVTVENATWNHELIFYPPIAGERDTRRIAGFPGPGEHVGNLFEGQVLWQRMLHANWAFYCKRVPRRRTDRFYIEPAKPWLPIVLSEAELPHRTLWIARDPRSELAENWTAGARRGALPRIVNCIDSPLTLAERECNRFVRARLDQWARVETTPDTICIRYEDLLDQTGDVWQRLRTWLGLAAAPVPRAPATGDEWPATRWRQLLPDAVLELYRTKMRAELVALGYAP